MQSAISLWTSLGKKKRSSNFWQLYLTAAAAAAKTFQSCLTVRPHRWQPTRLPHPWDSPGTNTGVGCHFLLQCMKGKSESEVAQSCPTLSNLMDCSLPGSSVHGIFQAKVLEWVAIAFSLCDRSFPNFLLVQEKENFNFSYQSVSWHFPFLQPFLLIKLINPTSHLFIPG